MKGSSEIPSIELLEMRRQTFEARQVVHRQEIVEVGQRRLHSPSQRLVLG